MNRVTDLASQNLTLSHLRDAQSRIAEARIQISSGKVADRYAGIARDAARTVNLESDAARADRFVANNKAVDLRLQKMEANTAAVFDVATRARTLLVTASAETGANALALGPEAQHMLDQLAGLLNDQMDGRFLFAGSRTDVPPVDLSALPADGVFAEGEEASYYRGDSRRLSVRAADSMEITYGVTADEAGFADLIRALQIVKTADPSDPEAMRGRVEEALGLVNKATETIPEIRSRIGAARSALESVNASHEEFALYAGQAIDDVQNIDVAEVITRLSGEQAMLEASFAALGRLRSISLLDYLR